MTIYVWSDSTKNLPNYQYLHTLYS